MIAFGAFRDLLGIRIEEFNPLRTGERLTLRWADGTTSRASRWQDLMRCEGAAPLAHAAGFGDGTATYLGTHLDEVRLRGLLLSAASEAGVRPAAETRFPGGLSLAPRGVAVLAG